MRTGSAGAAVDVRADGFEPGEPAEIHLHSEPVLLDTVTAGASGAVAATVTIPAEAPAGGHTIVVTGLESGHAASAALTIAPAVSEPADGPAAVTDGSLSWGVIAAFRSYVSGSIAQGSWETTGGATDSGGIFSFPVTTGSYDAGTDTLSASFSGSVRFSGHDMGAGPLLDLTIGGLRVQASGDTGALYADIRSRDMNDPSNWLQASDVHLGDLDLTGSSLAPVDGRIGLREVPVTLTSAGAAGFAGFYQAGQRMDPLVLDLQVAGESRTAGSGVDPTDPELASTGAPTAMLVGLALALLLVGGLAIALARRRKVRTRAH